MKNVIIAGASGMIGNLILQECLQIQDVQTVTCILRKPLPIQHIKLVQVIHSNFLDYSAIAPHFANQDICYYCIGVYTGQVPSAEFKSITVDYTKAFADMLKKQSSTASVCFLSGQGADSTEKSKVLFASQKGIAENYLLQQQFGHTAIFRPGYI
jgi:putative NADH-flavin reductase